MAADGFHLLLEAEDWVEMSKGDNLCLNEVEELNGILSEVDNNDRTEVEAKVNAIEDCMPLCTYKLVGYDIDDDDDNIRLFMAK